MNKIDNIIRKAISASYKVHNTLGAGFLEKVYEKALCIELKNIEMNVEQQFPITVYYKSEKVGFYYVDQYINNIPIVELKAAENLCLAHEIQLVNYLVATNIDDGLLMNFGQKSVEVKRKFRTYNKNS
ncbi:MAG: GxxExxY protein [Bacteroidales bacterium]|jgi:GxxExxY protein|nr:GxxExxY protein [Bacteroidales bacterium]